METIGYWHIRDAEAGIIEWVEVRAAPAWFGYYIFRNPKNPRNWLIVRDSIVVAEVRTVAAAYTLVDNLVTLGGKK